LVQKRLKEMIVAAVDEGDVDGGVFQPDDGGEAAETAAEDDDFVAIHFDSLPFSCECAVYGIQSIGCNSGCEGIRNLGRGRWS
jgi:hypothetical protein